MMYNLSIFLVKGDYYESLFLPVGFGIVLFRLL